MTFSSHQIETFLKYGIKVFQTFKKNNFKEKKVKTLKCHSYNLFVVKLFIHCCKVKCSCKWSHFESLTVGDQKHGPIVLVNEGVTVPAKVNCHVIHFAFPFWFHVLHVFWSNSPTPFPTLSSPLMSQRIPSSFLHTPIIPSPGYNAKELCLLMSC